MADTQMSFDEYKPGPSLTGRPSARSIVAQDDNLHEQRNQVAPGLRVGAYLSLQQRFEEWIETEDGKYVARWIRSHALTLRVRGWQHYSMKALWEAARFSRDVKVGPNAGFKLNNDYTSRLARRLMADTPALGEFFETRELKA